MKLPKILYFVNGSVPSKEDLAAVAELSCPVGYRNALAIAEKDAAEDCDGVAGAVPPQYKNKSTTAEALEAHKAKIKAQAEIVGDLPPPDPAQAPADLQKFELPQVEPLKVESAAEASVKEVAPGATPAEVVWKSNA